MSQQKKYVQFGAAIALIVVAMAYLAYTGVQQNKSYYVTIDELQAQASKGDAVYSKNLRVAGDVLPGSIKRDGMQVQFTLDENGKHLPVIYNGTDAPPDTFKDNAQALADGHYGRDGVFHATGLQAKCASKYEAKKS
jgi:cytochrome c-type biogenesis protein CcmE